MEEALEQLIQPMRPYVEGKIDFAGQKKAERLNQVILIVSGAASFITGAVAKDLRVLLAVFLLGWAIAFIVVALPLPMYNKNPIKWLPAKQQERKVQ